MSYKRIGLALALCAVCGSSALAQAPDIQVLDQPKPQYPTSKRGQEGWVVLNYGIDEQGYVVNPSIEESSGNDAFNEAALKSMQDWQFESVEEQEASVLVNFVSDRKRLGVSRKFFTRNARIHTLIDKGMLDDAQLQMDVMRTQSDLNAFELAYSFITEGRIAAERGDPEGQLRSFRKSMLNDGRWLDRSDYLKLLHAAVVLEIQLQDLGSALRDYELLTKTRPGKKIAADLEVPIQMIRSRVENGENLAPPYVAANSQMSVMLAVDRNGGYGWDSGPQSERQSVASQQGSSEPQQSSE